ncbi:MAG: hypothetical protein A3J93_03030 [Candidatus Magasanikbacteria bacterium RIFOXYC2_FULL_42_28]|uniref:glucose-6-phosphate isomerase n=1 Tax=Candidatus Magasanikbacteria bacterium RIFOXYC2_FULL_42_28 TaxID=1798704 RepID=A0A1F6NUC2_9BACT|nr:MAG: hypothetical protein A3J93_03030 [Candidatus Magasanikbacteria bacterium RIFOXYC2_FULL_42_28]
MNTNFSEVPKHYAARTHEKMQEVLMDPNGAGPAIHYYMIRGGSDQRNITVWEPGTISGEYIKTYGHYHIGNLNETYWFIFGSGIALLQKLVVGADGKMIPDEVAEFKAVLAKPGEKLFIPSSYGHLVANVGATYFVTADDSPVNFSDKKDEASMPGHADYEMVKKMQGFAYYVVEHDNTPTLKKNPRYKKIISEDLAGLPVIE